MGQMLCFKHSTLKAPTLFWLGSMFKVQAFVKSASVSTFCQDLSYLPCICQKLQMYEDEMCEKLTYPLYNFL